jgi:hypothetical protein
MWNDRRVLREYSAALRVDLLSPPTEQPSVPGVQSSQKPLFILVFWHSVIDLAAVVSFSENQPQLS